MVGPWDTHTIVEIARTSEMTEMMSVLLGLAAEI